MIHKIIRILSGFAVTLLGFIIMFDPIHYDYKFQYTFDFTEIRWSLGPAISLIGIAILIFSIKLKAEKFEEHYLKCPNCLKLFRANEVSDEKCKNCNATLEDLKGFFDRHPEKK